jgi:hypothetical protein
LALLQKAGGLKGKEAEKWVNDHKQKIRLT